MISGTMKTNERLTELKTEKGEVDKADKEFTDKNGEASIKVSLIILRNKYIPLCVRNHYYSINKA